MSIAKRVSKPAPGRPAPPSVRRVAHSHPIGGVVDAPPARERRVAAGQVTAVLADGRARFVTAGGRTVDCRCPQHVNVAWLAAAVVVAPVEAEAALEPGAADGGTVWCLFPSERHRGVLAPDLELGASERVKITCGESTLELDRKGTVRLRGRDVAARGSRVARLQGGSVRIN